VTRATDRQTAAIDAKSVAPSASGDECLIENNLYAVRTRGTWGYTTVMESHAGQDSWGGVDYSQTAGTSTTTGISYNSGANWSVYGSWYVGNDFGISTGFTKGPNWSYQWRVPMAYGFYTGYSCQLISGVKRLVYRYNSTRTEGVVQPNGAYADVPSGSTDRNWTCGFSEAVVMRWMPERLSDRSPDPDQYA
jgi:hypothetical protein